jgi:hypothetical protein
MIAAAAAAAEQYSGLHDMSPSFSRQDVIVVMKLKHPSADSTDPNLS